MPSQWGLPFDPSPSECCSPEKTILKGENALEEFLDRVMAPLVGRVPYLRRRQLREEIRGEFDAFVAAYRELGSSGEEAFSRALARLGPPVRLARRYARAEGRSAPILKILLNSDRLLIGSLILSVLGLFLMNPLVGGYGLAPPEGFFAAFLFTVMLPFLLGVASGQKAPNIFRPVLSLLLAALSFGATTFNIALWLRAGEADSLYAFPALFVFWLLFAGAGYFLAIGMRYYCKDASSSINPNLARNGNGLSTPVPKFEIDPEVALGDYLDHVMAYLVESVPYVRRQELRREMHAHLEILVEAAKDQGCTKEAAVRLALRQFGSPYALAQQWLEPEREKRAFPWPATRFALRNFGAATLLELTITGLLYYSATSRVWWVSPISMIYLFHLSESGLPFLTGFYTGFFARPHQTRGSFCALSWIWILSYVAMYFAGFWTPLLPNENTAHLSHLFVLFLNHWLWLILGTAATAVASEARRIYENDRFWNQLVLPIRT